MSSQNNPLIVHYHQYVLLIFRGVMAPDALNVSALKFVIVTPDGQKSTHCRTTGTECNCFSIYSRSEEGSQYMPHAQTSKHCRTTRDLQFRWHALYGL